MDLLKQALEAAKLSLPDSMTVPRTAEQEERRMRDDTGGALNVGRTEIENGLIARLVDYRENFANTANKSFLLLADESKKTPQLMGLAIQMGGDRKVMDEIVNQYEQTLAIRTQYRELEKAPGDVEKQRNALLDKLDKIEQNAPSINEIFKNEPEKLAEFQKSLFTATRYDPLTRHSASTALGNTKFAVVNGFGLTDLVSDDKSQTLIFRADDKSVPRIIAPGADVSMRAMDAEAFAQQMTADERDLRPTYLPAIPDDFIRLKPGLSARVASGQTLDFTQATSKSPLTVEITGSPTIVTGPQTSTRFDIRETGSKPLTVQIPTQALGNLSSPSVSKDKISVNVIEKKEDEPQPGFKALEMVDMDVSWSSQTVIDTPSGLKLNFNDVRNSDFSIPAKGTDKKGVAYDMTAMTTEERKEFLERNLENLGLTETNAGRSVIYKDVDLAVISPSGKFKETVALFKDGVAQYSNSFDLQEKLKQTTASLNQRDERDRAQSAQR